MRCEMRGFLRVNLGPVTVIGPVFALLLYRNCVGQVQRSTHPALRAPLPRGEPCLTVVGLLRAQVADVGGRSGDYGSDPAVAYLSSLLNACRSFHEDLSGKMHEFAARNVNYADSVVKILACFGAPAATVGIKACDLTGTTLPMLPGKKAPRMPAPRSTRLATPG